MPYDEQQCLESSSSGGGKRCSFHIDRIKMNYYLCAVGKAIRQGRYRPERCVTFDSNEWASCSHLLNYFFPCAIKRQLKKRGTWKSAQQALEELLLYVIDKWIIALSSELLDIMGSIESLQLGTGSPRRRWHLTSRWRHTCWRSSLTTSMAANNFININFYGHQNSLFFSTLVSSMNTKEDLGNVDCLIFKAIRRTGKLRNIADVIRQSIISNDWFYARSSAYSNWVKFMFKNTRFWFKCRDEFTSTNGQICNLPRCEQLIIHQIDFEAFGVGEKDALGP